MSMGLYIYDLYTEPKLVAPACSVHEFVCYYKPSKWASAEPRPCCRPCAHTPAAVRPQMLCAARAKGLPARTTRAGKEI